VKDNIVNAIEYNFDNLINPKTGKPVSIKCSVYVDTSKAAHLGRAAGRNIRNNIGGGSSNRTETI